MEVVLWYGLSAFNLVEMVLRCVQRRAFLTQVAEGNGYIQHIFELGSARKRLQGTVRVPDIKKITKNTCPTEEYYQTNSNVKLNAACEGENNNRSAFSAALHPI